jgi:hypothetical protein
MHLPGNTRNTGHNVGETIRIEGNFARQGNVHLQGARTCCREPNTEFLLFSLAQAHGVRLSVIRMILVRVVLSV